jgi:fibronectin-binding autotransporter adhesin
MVQISHTLVMRPSSPTLFDYFKRAFALMGLLIFCALGANAQTIIVENFSNASLPGWTVGQEGGTYTPSVQNGWLRLTDDTYNQSTYAVNNTSFASANTSVYAEFQFRSYGGNPYQENPYGAMGADGITFFLFDSSVSFNAGGYGGSLGYANRTGVAGLDGGFIGIGIDEFGNYSNPTEDRNGGPGRTPSSIAVRGDEAGGYQYLGGTNTLSTALWTSSVTPPTSGTGYGKFILSISPTGQLTVSLARDSSTTPTTILSMDVSSLARPQDLRFGFTGSTGGGTAFHEISALTMASVPAHLWDNGLGTGAWGSLANWNPETLPFYQGDVLLDNTWVSSAQSIDVQATRDIRAVYVDAPFNYTLNNGTLAFSGGTSTSTSGIIVSNNKGNGATQHTINSPITMANNIVVRNNSAANLLVGGTITTGGYTVNADGSGNTSLNGVISGTGGVTKTGSGTLTYAGASPHTYTGETRINEGSLALGASNRISSSSNMNVAGGIFNMAGYSQRVNNLTWSNNGSIDFGSSTGANVFAFNDVYNSPSGVITIDNWENGLDTLATKNAALGSTVLSQFYFSGQGAGATQTAATNDLSANGYGTAWSFLNPIAATWYTWDSGAGNGNWRNGNTTDRNNWDTNTNPPNYVNVAFGTGSQRNITLTGNTTRYVNGLRFDANASGTFTLGSTGDGDTLVMAGTSVGSSQTAFIQQKSNTYQQVISTQTLQLQNNTVVDMIGSQNLTINSAITGAGNLVKEGSGGKLVLTANNSSYTGNIFVNNGILQVSNSDALGSGNPSSTTVASGSTLELTNNINTPENINLAGAGFSNTGAIKNLSGNNTLSGTISLTDASTVSTDSGSLTINGSIISSSGNSLTVKGAANTTINSAISTGSGALTKDGSGTLTLAGNNSFRGDLTINAGTVTLGSSDRINDNVAVVMTGGTLNLNNNSDTVSSLSGSAGSVTLGSGTLTAGNSGNQTFSGVISGVGGNLTKVGSGTMTLSGTNSYTGTTQISQGTLQLGASNVLSDSTAVSIQSSATFAVNGQTDTIGNLSANGGTLAIGTGNLTTGTSSSTTFTGAITGTGTLTKVGTGTLTIDSNISYNGTINVNGGTLEFGSGAAGSTINNLVLNGGTLKLNNGALNINNLTITGTSTIDFGSGVVTLDVGTLTTNGSATLNISNWTDLTDYFFATNWVKDGTTYAYNSPPSRGATPLNQAVFSGFTGSSTAWIPFGGGHGQITPVPEPGTYGAMLLGSLLGLFGWIRWSRKLGQGSRN